MKLLFIIISIFIIVIQSKHYKIEDSIRYGVIVDAGSTQTRLYIYQFQGPFNASYSPYVEPMLIEGTNEQARYIQDGSITDLKREQLPEFFEGMINYAKEKIPKEKHKKTTFHVLATAGVRVLGAEKINKVITKVSEYLIQIKDFPFMIDEDFGVQVIPGEFEGAYDWLTVNYLAGTLNRKQVKDSIISIDFGGASIELTFEPEERLSEDSFPLRVNGTDRILYTQSYLKFGRNQALLRHRQMLALNTLKELNETQELITIYDPCFSIHYQQTIKLILNDKDYKFLFRGSSNYTLCQMLTLSLLRKDVFCAAEPCAMNGKHQPSIPLNRPIFALDSYSKLGKILNCTSKTNLSCLEQNALKLCNSKERLEHNELNLFEKKKFFTAGSECFLAAYGIHILKNFGIDPYRDIYLTDDYHGINIGWTLGAMIYELEIMSFKKGYCVDTHPLMSKWNF